MESSDLPEVTTKYRSFISDENQEKWEQHLAAIPSEIHQAFLAKKESYADEFRIKSSFIFKGLFEPCEDAIFEKGILVKINGKAYRLEGVTMLADITGGPFIGYLENDKVVWF
jgi:hypothetical protein